jgi:modulator of FtsH protease
MQSQWQSMSQPGGYGVAVDRNKVLRNTYLLLALTMIPTALGAVAGISMQFMMRGLVGVLLFFAISIGAFFAIERTKNRPAGVVILLAWTGFMGLWMSQMLQFALRLPNGGQLITMAAGGTAVIFFTLAGIATVSRRDFSFIGKFLMVGLVLAIVASLANVFLGMPALALAVSAMAVLIFAGYILYDVSEILNGGETNYVSATLRLYLDVYNLFMNLLYLLMALSGNDRR